MRSGCSPGPLARDGFPQQACDPELALQVLKEELLLDGNSKQNLATFCQTYESSWASQLMELGIDRNLIDKDEYPQTAAIEERCVHLLADLWHAPAPTVGCSTIGSSEAAMLGGVASRQAQPGVRQRADLLEEIRALLGCGAARGGDGPRRAVPHPRADARAGG